MLPAPKALPELPPINPQGRLPDITSLHGITIGGHFSPWGGSLVLTDADAFLHSNGKCAFNVSYDMKNIGAAPTAPAFANRLRSDATLISQQTGLSLNVAESKLINTQAYLAPGEQVVSLMLDDGNVVAESNEGNNLFRVKVALKGFCKGKRPPQNLTPDLVVILTNPMSGQVTVKNMGSGVAAVSKVALTCQKLGHVGPGGGCAELPEPLPGYPADPAYPDHVVFTVPALAPGASHVHNLSFWGSLVWNTGKYQFKAIADATNLVAESNEGNNTAVSLLTAP